MKKESFDSIAQRAQKRAEKRIYEREMSSIPDTRGWLNSPEGQEQLDREADRIVSGEGYTVDEWLDPEGRFETEHAAAIEAAIEDILSTKTDEEIQDLLKNGDVDGLVVQYLFRSTRNDLLASLNPQIKSEDLARSNARWKAEAAGDRAYRSMYAKRVGDQVLRANYGDAYGEASAGLPTLGKRN